jgi:hypothetical protein
MNVSSLLCPPTPPPPNFFFVNSVFYRDGRYRNPTLDEANSGTISNGLRNLKYDSFRGGINITTILPLLRGNSGFLQRWKFTPFQLPIVRSSYMRRPG